MFPFPRAAPLGLFVASLLVLAGCATRPVNPPLAHYEPAKGYFMADRLAQRNRGSKDNLVFLAFSGGGTRAAAFSYGVLEALRRIEIASASGTKIRLLDAVDVITGVSGGSFTALAYGLYGEKLFDDYDTRFLERSGLAAEVAPFVAPTPVDEDDGAVVVEVDGRAYRVKLPEGFAKAKSGAAKRPSGGRRNVAGVAPTGNDLKSPIQGTVLKVAVSQGDVVEAGQLICVVEAMKMENEMVAHQAGTATEQAGRFGQVHRCRGVCR